MSNDVDLQELAIQRDAPQSAGAAPRRHMLTRYVLPGILVAGFVALLAWATRDFFFPPQPVTVVPVLATQALVQEEGTPLFQAAGWIEPRPTPIRVAALAQGVVEELLVVEDQPVSKGEPVAEFIKDDARLSHQKATAELALRRAELDQAKAAHQAAVTRHEQPVHLEAPLANAEAALAKVETLLINLPSEIDQAEANREFTEKDYQSKSSVAGAVAGRAIDEAKSMMLTAQAVVRGLRDREAALEKERTALIARRDALKKQLDLLADEIQAKDEAAAKLKAAEAAAERARVTLAEAKLRLDRMTILAPVNGRVFRLIAHPGSTVAMPGGMTQMAGHDGTTVVTMYRPDSLQVRVDVRFEDIPKVRLNQRVEIDNPALESPLTGSVLFVSSEADIQKNTLQVKVAIDDPPGVFKPEMLVDVTFLAPKRSGDATAPTEEMQIYVPQRLIQRTDAGAFVWIADQSRGVARRANVQTGREISGGLIHVTKGLTVSSRLIASGDEHLADGRRIRVTGEDTGFATSSPDVGSQRRNMNRLPNGGH